MERMCIESSKALKELALNRKERQMDLYKFPHYSKAFEVDRLSSDHTKDTRASRQTG